MLFWLAGNVAGRMLGLIFSTCRVEMLGPPESLSLLEGEGPAIGASWHRSAIFLLYHFRRHKPAIMVSASQDGEYLARFIKVMGGTPVRGSSRRGGLRALKTMLGLLAQGQCRYAATVADGPTGPRYQVKKGMIVLARHSGLPLLPMLWSADRAWVLRNTWDKTMIPKPFSRVKLMIGPALRYPRKMTPDQMEQARLELESELNRIKDQVDAACGYQDPE